MVRNTEKEKDDRWEKKKKKLINQLNTLEYQRDWSLNVFVIITK